MKIVFDLNLGDLVAFVRYHDDHTPAVRRVRQIVTVIGIAPLVVLPLVLAPAEYRLYALAAGMISAIVVAFRMPGAYSRATERRFRKLYRGPAGANLFGLHELELTPTSLIKRTDVTESTTRLAALGPVAIIADYTFVYASPTTAFVIPRHAVRTGDYDLFTAAVAERVAAANPLIRR